ncbi:protein detoxification 7 [Quercus suber]|uniref:Protein detoxification 7 n=1 Tax=Quercus suber TaxID=58331 RepID=A0AAW0ME59_QUESU
MDWNKMPRSFNLTIAHVYSICLIPNLFSYAILQSLIHYFQTPESVRNYWSYIIHWFIILIECVLAWDTQSKQETIFYNTNLCSPPLTIVRDGWCIRDFMRTSLWSKAISKIGIYIYTSIISLILTQSLILPMLFSSFAALCFHIPFCWILVLKLKLGSSAAALASASS